jgi:hypothetical protein
LAIVHALTDGSRVASSPPLRSKRQNAPEEQWQRFVAVVLLWASPSTAQMKLDYSGLLAPQLGYINSNFALAPLSHIPFPEWNTPELERDPRGVNRIGVPKRVGA